MRLPKTIVSGATAHHVVGPAGNVSRKVGRHAPLPCGANLQRYARLMADGYQRTLARHELGLGDTATFEFRHWDESSFWMAGTLYRNGWDGSWCVGSEVVRSPHGRWDEEAQLINARAGSVPPQFSGRIRISDASLLRAGDIAVFWVNDPLVPSSYHRNQTYWGEVTLDAVGDRSLGRHKLFSGSEQRFSPRSFQYALRE